MFAVEAAHQEQQRENFRQMEAEREALQNLAQANSTSLTLGILLEEMIYLSNKLEKLP